MGKKRNTQGKKRKKKAATASTFSFDEERLRNNIAAESISAKEMVKQARKMRRGAIEMRKSLRKKSE